MKSMILVLVMLSMTACDEGQALIDAPSNIAKKFLRIDEKQEERHEDNQNKKLSELEERIAALEEVDKLHRELLDLAHSNIDANEDAIEALEFITDDLEDQLARLERRVFNDMRDIRRWLARLTSHIRYLRGAVSKGIKEIIDPCGDGPGFDEVLLKLNDGTILAYFESRGNRHLSVLSNGRYRTTDRQRCYFKVHNGQVKW